MQEEVEGEFGPETSFVEFFHGLSEEVDAEGDDVGRLQTEHDGHVSGVGKRYRGRI